jgi:dihydroorotate dehydrogenase electron transfer subunit
VTALGAERPLAPFGARRVPVSAVSTHGAYTVLHCADGDAPAPAPGQFYMLRAAERWGGGDDERPYLPRACSVLRSDRSGERQFLLDPVGPGTARLCELRAGDGLSLLGPLGVPFPLPGPGETPLLVGGGVGIAPLAILADALRGAGSFAAEEPPIVLLGFRDAAHAAGAELIAGARVATDDGSVGHPGRVTELLDDALADVGRPHVYACGPPAMLEAVRRRCAADGSGAPVPAHLALESGMACGYGACFGCVVPTRRGLIRLCVEGPVLDAGELETVLSPGTGH